MEILKEETINKHECPKCNGGLEWDDHERIDTGKKLFWIIPKLEYTNNHWFVCEKCNKRYLIKDALGEKDER